MPLLMIGAVGRDTADVEPTTNSWRDRGEPSRRQVCNMPGIVLSVQRNGIAALESVDGPAGNLDAWTPEDRRHDDRRRD